MKLAGNKNYVWALVIFFSIPVAVMAGGAVVFAIDPERLAGQAHYVRNFQLIQLAKGVLMLAGLAIVLAGWLATCLLVLRSKRQSYRWMALALLGPLGLMILASLPDLNPEPSDLYGRFDRKLKVPVRIAYELGFLILGYNVAWETMIAKREATIALQSALTGVSREQILVAQNASSGMWAFGELCEVMYFLVLLYLLRPVIVNVAGALLGRRGSSMSPGV
ncbi:MAG TPA: hypothetical protein VHZ53_02405 [Steroidobacteraceae bacterium]|jgi:hypothetical protein|nr:hypothetical protein [Steroidobacteraceae bacterium]